MNWGFLKLGFLWICKSSLIGIYFEIRVFFFLLGFRGEGDGTRVSFVGMSGHVCEFEVLRVESLVGFGRD